MTSIKNNITLAAVLLMCLSLKAQFHYTAPLDSVKETGFYSIAVTPQLAGYLRTDLADLRIMDEKKQPVPFLIEMPYSKSATGPVLFDQKITRKENTGLKTILVIGNTAGKELSNFIFELKSAAAARAASLSGSDNNKDWFVILDSLLLQPSEQFADTSNRQRVNFPAGTYKFYRLTINNNRKEPLNILKAFSEGISSAVDTIQPFFNNPAPSFSQTDSGRYSTIRMTFGEPVQVSRIQLQIAGPRLYRRQAKIFTSRGDNTESTWFTTPLHVMTISSDDFSGYTFPVLKSDTIYLMVENGDNPPLHVSAISTGVINRNIIAQLEKGKHYTLLLDNKNATAPDYDLQHFSDRITKPRQVNYGQITALSEPGVAYPQKKMNKRWIWPVIILVIALLSVLTWKLTADMKKKAA